jgi:hypothetical protein
MRERERERALLWMKSNRLTSEGRELEKSNNDPIFLEDNSLQWVHDQDDEHRTPHGVWRTLRRRGDHDS